MALIGSIAIAMAVDTRKLKAGLDQGSLMIGKFSGSVSGLGNVLGTVFAGVAVGKAVEGIRKMISGGSGLAENMSKVEAIFGSGSRTVVAAADEMAAAFGTSKNEFLDAAGKLGGLFKGAGFAKEEASGLSVEFIKLASDASSFFNLDFGTAFNKIRSGLAGESEPLKDLGILMNEDGVKAQAMAMGLAKAGQELSSQAKVQARQRKPVRLRAHRKHGRDVRPGPSARRSVRPRRDEHRPHRRSARVERQPVRRRRLGPRCPRWNRHHRQFDGRATDGDQLRRR